MARQGFPVDSFPDEAFGAHRVRRRRYVGNPLMHRSIQARSLTTAALLIASATFGGCASILPIAGAIALKEAAERYEKSEATSTRTTTSKSGPRASGTQAGESPELKAPEGSNAAKVASVPTSVASAEQSATESTARILATAIKRMPTPTSQPISSQRPAQNDEDAPSRDR